MSAQQWIVTGTSMVVEEETGEEAIARAQDMSGWHWEAVPAGELNPLVKHADLLETAQAAQDAAYGDSNDNEIELLRDAMEMALSALGLEIPEGREPDDEEA
jgi:hypothetical protein